MLQHLLASNAMTPGVVRNHGAILINEVVDVVQVCAADLAYAPTLGRGVDKRHGAVFSRQHDALFNQQRLASVGVVKPDWLAN